MNAFNLGLAPAFQPQRRPSTSIMTEGDYQAQNDAWLGDWQNKWNAATPTVTYSGPSREEVMGQAMSSAAQALQGSVPQYGQYLSDAFNAGGDSSLLDQTFGAGWFDSVMNYQPTQTVDDSARRALDAEKARQTSQWDLDRQTRQQNQQAQQQAYDQTNNGFAGGIIDSSYSSPWKTGTEPQTDPTQMNASAPYGQPWATPGFGGPTGGGSVGGYTPGGFAGGTSTTGGLGGLGGMQSPTPTQQAGMGGPFANNNPWAPSS